VRTFEKGKKGPACRRVKNVPPPATKRQIRDAKKKEHRREGAIKQSALRKKKKEHTGTKPSHPREFKVKLIQPAFSRGKQKQPNAHAKNKKKKDQN